MLLRCLVFLCLFAVMIVGPNSKSSAEAEIHVHRFAGPPYDAVNSYWIVAPAGVVIVDAQRLRHQAAYLTEDIRAETSAPVSAILITHHHPDHTGGLPALRAVFGAQVLIITSAFTRDDIAHDGRGLLAARRKMFGRDFPEPRDMPFPDRVVVDGENFTIAGLRFVARVLPNVDSPSSVVWLLPEQRIAFVGDFAVDRKTPSVRGGTSTSYLTALDRFALETQDYLMAYPGHGEPQPPAQLIAQTRGYLVDLRSLVMDALRNKLSFNANTVAEIKAKLITKHPTPFDTPLFPQEHEANIEATLNELRRQAP